MLTGRAGLGQASVTAIFHEVNLTAGSGAPKRTAALNDNVGPGAAITTSADSRVELTFSNRAVARLSEKATLSFKTKNVLDLDRGAVLIDVPRTAKAKIQAGGVAVGLSDVTAVLEYQSPAFKFLVLAGTGRCYRPRHPGDSVLISAGQMIFGSANDVITEPGDFDIERFIKTCVLVKNFAPLPSDQAIAAAIRREQSDKSRKRLADTNLVIFAGGSKASILAPARVNGNVSNSPAQTNTPSPLPSPPRPNY